jgi:hypothetical protein
MERVYTTPLLDKLGIRPGMRVALIDIDDPDIRSLIAARTSDLTEGSPDPDTDVVLLRAETPADLAPLETLVTRIRPNGAIWVVSRKGKAATLRYDAMLEAAKAAGLIDNKIASFSPTHTAFAWSSLSSGQGRTSRPVRWPGALYHPRMGPTADHPASSSSLVVMWRGPKTLPKLGEALGRGVKEANRATKAGRDQARAGDEPPGRPSGDRPA